MSLRTNLATRPFYNERAVGMVVLALAIIVGAVTVYNVVRLVSLTSRERGVAAEIGEAEAQARALQNETARARAGMDRQRVAQIAEAAGEANRLIDGRVFSWTALFNRFEATLPPDVRITSVHPRVTDDGRHLVAMSVVARSVPAIDRFLEALEETGAFSAMLARQESETEDGLIDADLEGYYDPAAPAPVKEGGGENRAGAGAAPKADDLPPQARAR